MPLKTDDIINLLPYSTKKNARYSISSINQMIRSYERRTDKKLSTKIKDEIRFIYILRIILNNLDCAPSSGQLVKVAYLNFSSSQNRLAICNRSMNVSVLNCRPLQ
jgi:hypothetical protein